MRYYKTIDENGFIIVSTLDADGDGNSTKSEYDYITDLYRNVPMGYGIIETANGFEYIPYPIDPELEEDIE